MTNISSINFTEIYDLAVSEVSENYEAALTLISVAALAYGVYKCCCSRPDPGSDPNTVYSGNGETPLIREIKDRDLRGVKCLLEEGADIEVCNLKGQTPLHVACEVGDRSIVSYLLEQNANPVATANEGWTPLMYAATNKTSLVAQELLKYIPAPQINAQNASGQTALHIAAEKGNLFPLNILLEKGADPTSVDQKGNLPLHAAANSGNMPIFMKVLEKTGEPNQPNQEEETPLHILMKHGRVPPKEHLGKFNPDIPNKNGDYPLHLAIKNSISGAIELLEAPDIDVNVQDKEGNTPALLAIKSGKMGVLAKLREKGADLTLANEKGETPFEMAILRGQDVQSFLEGKFNAELEEMKIQDLGLAEYAAAKGLTSMLAFLRNKGILFVLTEEYKEPLILEMRKTALEVLKGIRNETGIKIKEVDELIKEIENPREEKSSILEHLDLSSVHHLERIALQEEQRSQGKYDDKTELIGAVIPLKAFFEGLTGPRKDKFLNKLGSYIPTHDLLNPLKARVYPFGKLVQYVTEVFQGFVPSDLEEES